MHEWKSLKQCLTLSTFTIIFTVSITCLATMRFTCWLMFLCHPLTNFKNLCYAQSPLPGIYLSQNFPFFHSGHSPKVTLSIPMISTIPTQISIFILELFLNSKTTFPTAYKTSPDFTFKTPGEALHWLEMTIRETTIPLKKNEIELHPSKYI